MEITQEEFLEKYADVVVTFDHYYKFCFEFVGYTSNDIDGLQITVSYGGNASDIYRFELNDGDTFKLRDANKSFCRGIAETISGEIVHEFYEF